MGNHDKGFVKKFDKQTANSYVSQAHKQHVYATLGEEIRQQMQGLPYVLYKTHFGIKFAFTHYARYEDETFYEIDKFPTEQKYDDMYSNISADVIIFGHTHKSGYFKGKSEYINIPSIGCRAGDTAYCAVLTITQEKTLSLKEISLPYDKQALFEEMDKQNLPDKETMKQYYFNFKP